ncbi:MAG: type II toxin-antitoxin system death-on-curing family toxin [Patescibacteria group bacterium]
MTRYLATETVLEIHEELVIRYGGSQGVRDYGLVDSAVARPRAGFGDFEAYPDLFMKAAVLGHSLLKNHPFVDGNKRTAIASIGMFLEENGYQLIQSKNHLYGLALEIENNSLPEDKIAQWLKKHSKRIE